MAGIGFELKKLFKKNSIFSVTAGAGYSALITVGPTAIVMVTLIVLYMLLGISDVTFKQRELLSTTILYVFIFSSILTAGFNSVFSRYIADKFFEEEFEGILPSYYIGLAILGVISTIIALPFCYRLYTVGNVDIYFLISSYFLWISSIFLYFSMTYLHATKDYRRIALSFLLGMLISIGLALLFHSLQIDVTHSILYALTIGFFIIASLVASFIHKYFEASDYGKSEVISYIFHYKEIFITNFLYFLGLYIHNFVFWSTDGRTLVAETMISMQPYDMATCLALFTNISTLMIFIVMAETDFHDAYKNYMEAVIGSTYDEIYMNKKKMFRIMKEQIIHVFALQTVITAIIFIVFMIFLPQFGFSGLTMTIYPALAAGYLAIFLTYCLIIYLFYYNDNKGAMLVSIVFCAAILIGSLWSSTLTVNLYGFGAFLGSLIGWSFGYFRLRYLEKNFEKHIFMKQKFLKIKTKDAGAHVVYKK